MSEMVRMTAWVHGSVQAVGFRWWTCARAVELGLTGWAENLSDSRVEVVAEGPRGACEQLLQQLRSGRAPGSVEKVVVRFSSARGGLYGFVGR